MKTIVGYHYKITKIAKPNHLITLGIGEGVGNWDPSLPWEYKVAVTLELHDPI